MIQQVQFQDKINYMDLFLECLFFFRYGGAGGKKQNYIRGKERTKHSSRATKQCPLSMCGNTERYRQPYGTWHASPKPVLLYNHMYNHICAVIFIIKKHKDHVEKNDTKLMPWFILLGNSISHNELINVTFLG